jgi:hypothetical protein
VAEVTPGTRTTLQPGCVRGPFDHCDDRQLVLKVVREGFVSHDRDAEDARHGRRDRQAKPDGG